MQTLSLRIKHYRKKKGLTQEEVAKALGIRVDNYAKYESGTRSPKNDRLMQIAKIFGVSSFVLRDGVERLFLDLLYHYCVRSVLNDIESFESFMADMEYSDGAYDIVSECFKKGEEIFKKDSTSSYKKHIENPSISSLIELYEIYKNNFEMEYSGENRNKPQEFDPPKLDATTTSKWAFCIATHKYLDKNEADDILKEAAELSCNHVALTFFAVQIFVPYLSFIIDAVEPCYLNTSINDFEISFLYNALSRPDAEEPSSEDE